MLLSPHSRTAPSIQFQIHWLTGTRAHAGGRGILRTYPILASSSNSALVRMNVEVLRAGAGARPVGQARLFRCVATRPRTVPCRPNLCSHGTASEAGRVARYRLQPDPTCEHPSPKASAAAPHDMRNLVAHTDNSKLGQRATASRQLASRAGCGSPVVQPRILHVRAPLCDCHCHLPCDLCLLELLQQ